DDSSGFSVTKGPRPGPGQEEEKEEEGSCSCSCRRRGGSPQLSYCSRNWRGCHSRGGTVGVCSGRRATGESDQVARGDPDEALESILCPVLNSAENFKAFGTV